MLVLVVDDEPIARMTHLALLSKLPEVTAIGAGTVAEARALLQESLPEVALIDLELPDGTGLDIVNALEQSGSRAVVVVVSAHLDEFRPQLPESERIHQIPKPLSLATLARIIESTARSSGSVAPFSAADYVQLACMGKHSAVLDCSTADGGGEIVIVDGQLWAAHDGQGEGSAAFGRLVAAEGAQVRVRSGGSRQLPRNIEGRWDFLLLEAMRLRDEQGRGEEGAQAAAGSTEPADTEDWFSESAQPAPAGAAPAAPASAAPAPRTFASLPPEFDWGGLPAAEPTAAREETFEALTERALQDVVSRRYSSALAAYEKAQALRPEDRSLQHRIHRLRSLCQQDSSED